MACLAHTQPKKVVYKFDIINKDISKFTKLHVGIYALSLNTTIVGVNEPDFSNKEYDHIYIFMQQNQ